LSGYSSIQKPHQPLLNTNSCVDLSPVDIQEGKLKDTKSLQTLQKDIMSASVKNLKGFRKYSDGQDGQAEKAKMAEENISGLIRANVSAKKLKLQMGQTGSTKQGTRNADASSTL
jgi:hypothetical protein